jgi:PTS system fructose-specific IIC component
MLLRDVIQNNLYFTNIKHTTKKEVLADLINTLDQNGLISNKGFFYQDIISRENISSTFMGNLVAIPHAKSDHVKEVSISLGVSPSKIKNDNTIENDVNNEAQIFFMLAIPKLASDLHLSLISELAQLLIQQDFCNALLLCKSKENVLEVFDKFTSNNNNKVQAVENTSNHYDLVAITACPVGIAHTYIAAEKLQSTAQSMGYSIKVQTNGSIGIKNTLSSDDIKHAKAVIIASDIDIEDDVFVGKAVYKCPVAEAVRNSESVIKKSLLAPVLSSSSTKSEDGGSSKTATKLGAYKHLLNGVSFMIPFVVMGGILIAIAIALSGINAGSGVAITNDILKKMEALGAMSFGLMVPILAGYIGYSIGGKPALAPSMVGGMLANSMQTGFLGGILIGFIGGYAIKYFLMIPVKNKTLLTIMPVLIVPLVGVVVVGVSMYSIGIYIADFMSLLTASLKMMSSSGNTGNILFSGLLGLMIAIDMGGPINKVAFLFGVSMIAAGVPTIMGPIAVAIAVPPLGMALATFIRTRNYSLEEKQAGKAAFFMGMIGITEGAIPFAASDPLRVIPAIVAGGAVGGALAGYFKVANYAPHGGPIVLPVVDNVVGFLISLAVGVLVTAIIVNILKSMNNKKSQA